MDWSATSSPELSEETDADLLLYMSMRESDSDGAREAWDRFCARHAEYLFHVCSRYSSLLGGEPGVCDLVQDTLIRVFENAEKFDAAGLTKPDELRVRARAWMGKIAVNLFRSKLRKDGRLPTEFLDQMDWQDVGATSLSTDDGNISDGKRGLYQRALSGLSERERDVLRLYGQYHQPGQDHQKLPDGVAESAAERLGTTPENLRQIKKRTLNQVADFIKSQEPPPSSEQCHG